MITGMEVLDPTIVRFTLDVPTPLFPRTLSGDVGMITNPRLIEERGAEAFASDPTGGGVGAFELESYTPGVETVMKAKDDYWGGTVCIERLRFVSIADARGALDALQNDEIDVAWLRDVQLIDETRESGLATISTINNAGEAVVMNSSEGSPTSDVTVRRAVVAALDLDAINARVFDGAALATKALVHPESGDLYDNLRGPAYDPDVAEELVEEAKASGWNGRVRLLANNAPYRVEMAIVVAAQLEAVGFEVDVDSSKAYPEWDRQVVVDRDYDMVLWAPTYPVGGGNGSTWTSS